MPGLANLLLLAIPLGIAVAARKKKPAPPGVQKGFVREPTVTPVTPPVREPTVTPVTPPAAVGPIIASFPDDMSPQLGNGQRMLIDAVLAGRHDPLDFGVVSSIGDEGTPMAGYRLAVPVMRDALKIEGVRPIGTHLTAQEIADRHPAGLLLLTPYVAGLISAQADAKLAPTILSPVTSTKAQMIQASAAVDRKLAAAGVEAPAMVSNPSKDWVLTIRHTEPGVHPVSKVPRSEAAANHGLYRAPFDPIQNVGLAHNLEHTDYSQMLRFMGRTGILEHPSGEQTFPDLVQLLTSGFAPLLTGTKGKLRGRQAGEGVLPYSRHPAIPTTFV